MTQDEIIEMARRCGFSVAWPDVEKSFIAFAKLVAEKAIAKDREEFDIDELCARQNKIGYKQGYNAGVLAEREACAKVCEELAELSRISNTDSMWEWGECAAAIRARGNV